MKETHVTMGDSAAFLRERGIKPSYTRRRILECIANCASHPTVSVFQELHDELPTLSKTTVYNVLKLFEEHDIVQSVVMDDQGIRYEFNTEFHGHMKCIKCKQVFDIDLDVKVLESKEHEILTTKVVLTGICFDCRFTNNKSKTN